ncbi:hypothetical protein M9H77_02463 [Catharanthus roseus]|uniref:Uncharacterized protein n=1 Tax=Catharanthus roseus TaxID=4058 RepID=A0ACC0C8Z1_CATRO|nr:hypothetical protein M9H77_02463 [Catharanthus roseus]
MECNWSNSSLKRIEEKSKLKDSHSSFARDMYNFYHGGGNRINAYRHVGVGNFSAYAKSFGHTSYDDYGGHDRDTAKYDFYEHSPYDCYVGYHHCYDFLERMVFKEEGKKFGSFENFVSTFHHLNREELAFVKYKVILHFQMLWCSFGK